jgi:hypothetical protein
MESTRKPPGSPTPQVGIPKPVAFRLVTAAIALCGLVFLCFLLFGFVTFINSWNSWHRYEGQPFHRADFVVEHDYYQPYSKHADLYASGMVEGNREWMDLVPYLQSQKLNRWPHGVGELESLVPAGTVIPIYLFPGLRSRSRVRLYSDTPPAEQYYRTAMKALNYGLCGMAVCALAIFLLVRVRASRFEQSSPATSSEMRL